MVYDKYIRSPEALVRQHELLARYFQRLPALSARKLSCLAHHLEVAGLWHKLRDALVDVDHFPLWWALPRRKEFVALWASLSNRRAALAAEAAEAVAATGAEHLVGGGHGGRFIQGEFDEATMRAHQVRLGGGRRCFMTERPMARLTNISKHRQQRTGSAAALRRGGRVRARRGGVAGAAPPGRRGAPAGTCAGRPQAQVHVSTDHLTSICYTQHRTFTGRAGRGRLPPRVRAAGP